MAKKRSSAKRDLVKSKKGASYAKRTSKGRFKERDTVRRSQPADRRTKAKRKVKSGTATRAIGSLTSLTATTLRRYVSPLFSERIFFASLRLCGEAPGRSV